VATIASFNAGKAMKNLQQSVNRLSSGKRITSPGDDAGGLSVHYKLQSVLKRTEATRNNLHNGISFLQVQDGAYQVASRILDRMAELKTFWSDISKSDTDRINYNYEFKELQEQLALIEKEKFNGVNLYSRNPYDENPTKIITTEDGRTGIVDITRTGFFDNIDISDTYRDRLTNSTYGGAFGGTAEPMVIKNYESTGSYKAGDIIRGRFEDGQVRMAVALNHIGEATTQQDLIRLADSEEIHDLQINGAVQEGDEFVVTLNINGQDHYITVTSTDDSNEAVAKAIAAEINAKGLSVSAEVDTTNVILTSSIKGSDGNFTVARAVTNATGSTATLDGGELQDAKDVDTSITQVTFTLNGTDSVSVPWDTDGTTATMKELVTAINTDANLSPIITAKANGDGSILIEGNIPGNAFTATLETDAADVNPITGVDSFVGMQTVNEANAENWSPNGRDFEAQHQSFRLLYNGDPVSKVFKAIQTISNPNPDLRVIADQQGIPTTVIVDENVTGYQPNQAVTINLNNGAHGVVETNESGTIVKGSEVQVVNEGDGSFIPGESTIVGILGGISGAGDTYEPGEVVYNEADRSYYVAVGEGGDYTKPTQAVAHIGQNTGEFVKLGEQLPAIRDYEAFSEDSVYARNDVVYYNDKLYIAVAESVAGTSVNGYGEYITPENDANNAYWLELSTYSGQGSGILDMTKDLDDFEVHHFVDYIQVLANSRAMNGGEMSRLNYSDDLLIQNQINLEAADGRIIDADMALESTRLAKNQVLAQASIAMVAQANTVMSLVLSLLGQ
jgi:flagellin-like hook-associated protein FlgL